MKMDCMSPTPYIYRKEISIMCASDIERNENIVAGKELDFNLAKPPGEMVISGVIASPMLIAWFDGKQAEE